MWAAFIPNPKFKLMEQLREVMRLEHYAIQTEQSYSEWIRRYIHFHNMRSREELVPGTQYVELLLRDLALNGRVSANATRIWCSD